MYTHITEQLWTSNGVLILLVNSLKLMTLMLVHDLFVTSPFALHTSCITKPSIMETLKRPLNY